MEEKLQSPPLIEALCEFRFDESSTWDWTIPGQLYDRIKGEFPERSEAKSLELKIFPAEPATTQTVPERVQLKKSDNSAIVQIGPNLLAINQLEPYSDWNLFRELIISIYNEYRDVAIPNGLQRIGLRYINKLEYACPDTDIREVINHIPQFDGNLKYPLDGFFQRYSLKIDSLNGHLIHQTGSALVNDSPMIMLDLDFNSTEVQHLTSIDSVISWLDDAHSLVHQTFVDSLNPELYERLKGGA